MLRDCITATYDAYSDRRNTRQGQAQTIAPFMQPDDRSSLNDSACLRLTPETPERVIQNLRAEQQLFEADALIMPVDQAV